MSVKMESSWLRVCCAGKCRIRIFDTTSRSVRLMLVSGAMIIVGMFWLPGHQVISCKQLFHPEYLADCWILLQILSDILRYAVYTRHCNHFYQITLNQQHQQHISADYTTSCQDSAALYSSNTYLQYQHETLSVQKLCKIFRTRKKC